jgi:hypothetical protein
VVVDAADVVVVTPVVVGLIMVVVVVVLTPPRSACPSGGVHAPTVRDAASKMADRLIAN